MTFFTRKRRLAVVAALTLTVAAGCVGRKQYQINEAILISERRQLEDELYRLQFELRDALEENERLRGELGDGTGGSSGGGATGAGGYSNVATRSTVRDESSLYPGGAALQTPSPRRVDRSSSTANAGGYRDSNVAPSTGGNVETLPDYVPIPLSSASPASSATSVASASLSSTSKTPTTSRPDARPLGVRREIANNGRAVSVPTTASTALAASTSGDARSNVATSDYVENATATPRRVEQTNYRKTARTVADAAATESAVEPDVWSPLAR